jgi:hypothetical protein
VVGNEFEVEGRLYLSGLVRNAKDAQRMYNYWVSQEAEMLALAPKAPFVGYSGQFEGYEQQWKRANVDNYPYLEVNADATDGMGSPLPLPQRAMPPQASSGVLQAKAGAADDIKSATGQYDASLGMAGNEKSGKAILARERQSDIGTYHYVDNLARAVRHCTRQIVDLIPKIYDTQRIARIIGMDGETEQAEINPNQEQPVNTIKDENGAVIKKIYNLGIGTYDVCVTTGPSYMTKRQESLEAMAQLLQGNPQLWAVAGDLFIKNMDWPGADEMAERFRKTLDPKLLSDDDAAPEVVALQQQLEQMGQELDQAHEMLKQADVSIEAKEMQNKHYETDIKAYQAETQRLSMLASFQTDQAPNIKQEVLLAMQELLSGSATMEQEEPSQLEQGEQYKTHQIQQRAKGGPVNSGQPYLVGEMGPEIIIPKNDGNVLTNEQSKNALYDPMNNDPEYRKQHEQRRVPPGNLDALTQGIGGSFGKGNIYLNDRMVYMHPGGENYSSLESITLGGRNGEKAILIPKVDENGNMLSNEEAINKWRNTGQHLGEFDTEEEANKYAIDLEKRQSSYYETGPGRKIIEDMYIKGK